MKRIRTNTNLYQYLVEHDADFTDGNAVARLKKQFYREYNTRLKQEKRKDKRVFYISFPKSEILHIRRRARHYDADVVGLLKLLVRSELEQNSVIENTLAYKRILQLLQNYKAKIEAIEAKENNKWFKSNDYETLYRLLESIRNEIMIKKR